MHDQHHLSGGLTGHDAGLRARDMGSIPIRPGTPISHLTRRRTMEASQERGDEITELVHVTKEQGAVAHALTAQQVIEQVEHIQKIMKGVMREGEHYGVIPGTKKPTLYKPGAEKLCLTFRLRPEYTIDERDLPDGHRECKTICDLYDIVTGNKIGSGVGSCSTMESKYRYRKEERVCPRCGMTTIIKGKDDYGGGWVCWKKQGGCGANFKDGDPAIEGQVVGRIENPDIADTYNTILKMSKKRAHVDATLTATAASDIFTQDTEDMAGLNKKPGNPGPKAERPPAKQQTTKPPDRKAPPAEDPPPPAITDNFEFLKAMKEMKENLTKLLGDEAGTFEYYEPIHKLNFKKSNQIVDEEQQKAVWRKLRARYDKLMEEGGGAKEPAGDDSDIWLWKPVRSALGEFTKEALDKSLTEYYNEYAYPIDSDPNGIKAMLTEKRATKAALIDAHVLILKWEKEQRTGGSK